MKYPITASVTFVQTSADRPVVAYVSVSQEGGKRRHTTQEFDLGKLSDATDLAMWMQMATASVCDAL